MELLDQCAYIFRGLFYDCRASLVAQLVKNLPAMQETWVRSLGWEDPLEKGKATHSSILAWRTPWTLETKGHKELDTTERLSHTHYDCKGLPQWLMVKNLSAMQETWV